MLLLLTERWRRESPWVVRGSITATSWWMLFLEIRMKMRMLFLVIKRVGWKTRMKKTPPEEYLRGNSVTGSLASWVTSSNR